VRIIQAGGVLTVLCLGLFLLINFRRDMREARAQRDLLHGTHLGTRVG
jgi:hypothetical protein